MIKALHALLKSAGGIRALDVSRCLQIVKIAKELSVVQIARAYQTCFKYKNASEPHHHKALAISCGFLWTALAALLLAENTPMKER